MDALQNLLNETVSKFEALKLENEATITDNLEKAKKECSPEQYEILETAFNNARQGKGSAEDLIKQFKNFT